MKFLVDAQLPLRLAILLNLAGHDALHTSNMPKGNRTTDADVMATADADDRVVVTKDGDFRDTHLLNGTPHRLLLVRTGNIDNSALLSLVESNLDAIQRALEEVWFVELSAELLTIHDDRR